MAGKYSLLMKARPKRISPLKSIGVRWPKGCQGGVINALILGISTLILNIAIAWWLSTAEDFNANLVVFQRRSCRSSNTINIIGQVIINILATLLMAASNYCMQILSSPLREEVDAAHAAKKWLYIGVPNLKNLRHIPWTRRMLCLILVVSSLPVHLLWNSAIIQEIPSNNYLASAVSVDFISGAPINASYAVSNELDEEQWEQWLDSMRQNSTKLEAAECITAYSKPFVSEYSNLVLVMNVHNSSNALLGTAQYKTLADDGSSAWFEGSSNQNASYWDLFVDDLIMRHSPPGLPKLHPVDYCLVQKTHRTCRVGLIPVIIWIVLAANLFKVTCFCGTLLLVRNPSKPLITSGDTIQSFVSKPDPDLSQRCLSSIKHVQHDPRFWTEAEMPLRWLPKPQIWSDGAPLSSWLSLFLPSIMGIIYVIYLYIHNNLNSSLHLGFSSISSSALISQNQENLNHGIIASVLLANTPQLILTYMYTAYNALLTSMLAHSEVLRYSTKHRGLRVTQPMHRQRSSYYLSLPYRFSIPLIIVSAVLHWLVSESFFLVRVTVYNPDGTENSGEHISTVGYSAYAIIVSLTTMVSILLAIIILGRWMRYSASMPLAATCSASMAAICQPAQGAEYGPDLALQPLSWGSVDQELTVESDGHARRVRHAAFSSGRVSPLVRGATYQ